MRSILALAALACVAGCAAKPGVCDLNSDCARGYYCHNTQCRRDCIVNIDCPTGFICNIVGKCDPGSSGGDGGGPQPDLATSAIDAAMPNPDLAGADFAGADLASQDLASQPDLASGGVKHELDLCAADGECAAPLVCRALTQLGVSRCTRACTSTASCLSGQRCLLDPVGTKTCLGEDIGRTCTSLSDCNFGCLTGPGYCTAPCSNGFDCPNGYGCMPVNTPPQSVCVKLEAVCDTGNASACIVPAACDTSAALLVGGCTSICNSPADCPQRPSVFAPWTCDAGGICRRPPDVYGPLPQGYLPAQYACNQQSTVVNLCSDAQHIDFTAFTIPGVPSVNCSSPTATPGAPGDACVDSCLDQGGCIFGYACTAVGNIGGARIGLCLPSYGSGEVGTHCNTDADCVFGYCIRSTGLCSRDCTFDSTCPTGSTCTATGGPPVEGFAFKRCQ